MKAKQEMDQDACPVPAPIYVQFPGPQKENKETYIVLFGSKFP